VIYFGKSKQICLHRRKIFVARYCPARLVHVPVEYPLEHGKFRSKFLNAKQGHIYNTWLFRVSRLRSNDRNASEGLTDPRSDVVMGEN
jgi:hypothetical protein